LEDNIQKDAKEIVCEFVNWVEVVQDKIHWRVVVDTVLQLWVI